MVTQILTIQTEGFPTTFNKYGFSIASPLNQVKKTIGLSPKATC